MQKFIYICLYSLLFSSMSLLGMQSVVRDNTKQDSQQTAPAAIPKSPSQTALDKPQPSAQDRVKGAATRSAWKPKRASGSPLPLAAQPSFHKSPASSMHQPFTQTNSSSASASQQTGAQPIVPPLVNDRHKVLLERAKKIYLGIDGVTQDENEAFRLFGEIATQTEDLSSQAEALVHIGDIHFYGKAGLPENKQEALKNYQKVENNTANPAAQAHAWVCIANLYYDGKGGVEKKLEIAKEYYQRVENQNALERIKPEAWVALGEMHRLCLGGLQGESKAVQYYTKAADQTYNKKARAQGKFCLGMMHEEGLGGLAKEPANALPLYLEAESALEKEEHASVLAYIGRAYHILNNDIRALEYFKKAAEQTYCKEAQIYAWYMITVIETDTEKSYEYFEKLAEQNENLVLKHQATLIVGLLSLAKDEKKAVRFFEQAAQQTASKDAQVKALLELGEIRYKEKKVAEAEQHFEKALEIVDLESKYRIAVFIGNMYREDHPTKALKCYRLAENQTTDVKPRPTDLTAYADACYAIGELYRLGKGGLDRDYEKALAYYRKAEYPKDSKKAYARACVRIGAAHYQGVAGLKEDKAKGVEYYEKAANQTDAEDAKAEAELKLCIHKFESAAAENDRFIKRIESEQKSSSTCIIV